jgi:hypothetical protein
MQDLHDKGSVDPVYHAKARVLNRALQEIRMGRYQVQIRTLLPSVLEIVTVSILVGAICRRWFWTLFVSGLRVNY